MDLADLQIFKTVADEGGVLRAARKLHRVQSNVTTRIRQLETSLGVALFIRERQRLHLSADGLVLLGYARRLLALADEAQQAVTNSVPSGLLRIGSLEATAASRLPTLLAAFHTQYPEVRIELRTGTNDQLLQLLAERQLDAAFTAEPPIDPELAHEPAFAERLVLISPAAHPPISRAAQVASASLIAFPSGCAYRRVLERWLGVSGLQTRRVLELHSYHAIVACVAAGTGLAIVPESVLEIVPDAPVGRHALPKVHRDIVTPLVWRGSDSNKAVLALRGLLRERSAERARRVQR